MVAKFVILAPNSLVPEFSYKMNQLAWGGIFTAFALVVLIAIWNVIRKPLSKLMKVKQAKVEVVYVQKREANGYGLAQKARKDAAFASIAVRFLEPKRWRRKSFFMSATGFSEGDKGVLTYQGAYGINFEKEGSAIQDSYDYRQKYGFEKKKKEEAKKSEKTYKKRKYW